MESSTNREEKHLAKDERMVAQLRSAIDTHATAIIDGKSEFALAYLREDGVSTVVGVCGMKESLQLTLGLMDLCGQVHGAATGNKCEKSSTRILLVALMAIREIYSESTPEERQEISLTAEYLLGQIYEEYN